jgi:hypothetical protein
MDGGRLTFWAGIASIVGVAVSVVGFVVTIVGVWRSRSAAEQAKAAARETRESILKLEIIQDFTAVTTIMEEIKRLHRASAWAVLPDRYTALRKLLGAILAANPDAPDEHIALLVGSITQFRIMENTVERALAENVHPDTANLNKIVSQKLDKIDEALSVFRLKL